MSRCVQFHHLYDKDASACGMSPVSESYYKRYREAVRKLVAQKIDEDVVYSHFTEGAYRVILAIKNEDTRTDALSYVSECLHNSENVTERDLKGWLKVWRIEHGEEPEKLTNVKSKSKEEPSVPLEELPPQPSLAAQMNGEPVPEPAFKTALEVKQGLMAPEREPKPEDPAKVLREKRLVLADNLMETYSERFQMECRDYLRSNNKGAKTNADIFYFAVEELIERKGKK